MLSIEFIYPRLGFKAGDVWHTEKIGVAKTLIQIGVCKEVVKNESKLDSAKNVKTKRAGSKPRRSKKPS